LQNNYYYWNCFSNQYIYINWSIQSCLNHRIEIVYWRYILFFDEYPWSFFSISISQIHDYYKSNNHRLRIIICLLLSYLWIYSFHNSAIYEYMKKNNQFHQLIKMSENFRIWSKKLISNCRYINFIILMINNAPNWVFKHKTAILQILKYIPSIIFNMILKAYISIFHQNIWWQIISSENQDIQSNWY